MMESPSSKMRGSFGLSSIGSAASRIRADAVSCFVGVLARGAVEIALVVLPFNAGASAHRPGWGNMIPAENAARDKAKQVTRFRDETFMLWRA